MTKDQEHIVPEFPDSFALRSPRLWATWYDGYMTVPEDSVYRAIDALRTSVALHPIIWIQSVL
jgi:hypothetical protein